MAVIDEETKQKAKELWLQGKKYREISEITGIKESSIKSLASRIWKKEKLQPNKKKVAKMTSAQVREIAELKMPDLNAASVEAAMSMIAGTARSMGVVIED